MRSARWWLAGIAAAGLGLRLWGLDFGLPGTLARPDEAVLVHRALAAGGGDLNPHFFNYPSLQIYLLTGAFGLYYLIGRAGGTFSDASAFLAAFLGDPTRIFLIGRLLGVLAGTASVVLAYRLGRRLGGDRAGLAAAAFLAVAPLHVRDSHFATVDGPVTFWMLAALVACWRYLQSRARGDLAATGLLLGLAASTKYSAALFAPALLLAPFLGAAWRSAEGRDAAGRASSGWRGAVLAGGAMAFGFLLGTPYALLDPGGFGRGVAFEGRHFVQGHLPGPAEGLAAGSGWVYHITVSLWHGSGWPVALLGWAGLAYLARRRHPEDVVLLAMVGAYLAVAGAGKTHFLRYALPLVPLLCLAAGTLLAAALRGRRWGWVLAAAILVALPGARAAWQTDRLLAATDTRLLAAAWVEGHAAEGSTVALTGSEYGYPPLRRSARWLAERLEDVRASGGAGRRLGLELAAAERGRRPGYYLAELRPSGPERRRSVWGERSLSELGAAGVEWLVVQEHDLAYSRVPARLAPELATLEPAVSFEPFTGVGVPRYDPIDAFYVPYAGFAGVSRPGPAIRVYDLRPEAARPACPPPSPGRAGQKPVEAASE